MPAQSTLAAKQKQKDINTELLSIFVFSLGNIANPTFNALSRILHAFLDIQQPLCI